MPRSRAPRIQEREGRITLRKNGVRVGREDYRGWVALVLCLGCVIVAALGRLDALTVLIGPASMAVGWYFSTRERRR